MVHLSVLKSIRAYVRTYARYVRTYAWWAAPPREDALIDLGRRTRIAHRGSQLNDNARYAGCVRPTLNDNAV